MPKTNVPLRVRVTRQHHPSLDATTPRLPWAVKCPMCAEALSSDGWIGSTGKASGANRHALAHADLHRRADGIGVPRTMSVQIRAPKSLDPAALVAEIDRQLLRNGVSL